MKYLKDLKVYPETLSNGLQCAFVNNISSEFVTFLLLVKVGSRNENDNEAGIAHCLEHMFFKGSKLFPSSIKLAMEIEKLGGMTNAFTSYEYTGYYIKVPKHNYSKALTVFADLIRNPILKEEELKKEKGVILEEIKMYKDLPQERVKDKFNEILFHKHALGRDIAGDESTLKNIDVSALKNFIKLNYGTNNSLLVISGDIERSELTPKVTELFSGMSKSKSTKPKQFYPVDLTKKLALIEHPSEQAHLVLGGIAYKYNHPSEMEFKLGMNILAQGFGSKLFQSLREEHGIAYYTGGGVSTFSDTGKYVVAAGVAIDKLEVGIESIIEAINEIKSGKFTNEDITRAKNYQISSILENFENVEDTAVWIGLNKILDRNVKTPGDLIEKIDGIKKQNVIDTWNECVTSDNILLSLLAPKSSLNHDRIEALINKLDD